MAIQIVWFFFEDFSFMTFNTMISITVPGIAQIIQKVLVNFIYLDIFMTEKYIPYVLERINGN